MPSAKVDSKPTFAFGQKAESSSGESAKLPLFGVAAKKDAGMCDCT